METARDTARRFYASAVAVLLLVACLALCSCTSTEEDSEPVFSNYDEDQIAATVNGKPILESDVTRTIELLRFQDDAVGSDLKWARVLDDAGLTPDTLRQKVIDQCVQDELTVQESERLKLSPDTESIDEQIEKSKENFGSTAEWTRALYRSGYYSDDSYRRSLEVSDLTDQLKKEVTSDVAPTTDEVASYISKNAYKYSGKRSSCILIIGTASMPYEEMVSSAQSILDDINSGSISFEDAAVAYSADKTSAAGSGDIGWSSLVEMPEDYQSTLEGLSVGKVSGLVSCSYGIYIIKCTDIFSVPSGTSIDAGNVPSEICTTFRTKLVEEMQGTFYTQYMSSLTSAADIEVNQMPSGLSYDVDMGIIDEMESVSVSMSLSHTETGQEPMDRDYSTLTPSANAPRTTGGS